MRTDNKTLHAIAETVNRGEWSEEIPLLPWGFDDQLANRLYQKIDPTFSLSEPDPESCLKKLDQFRILGALRQGPFGIDALNKQIVQEMGKRIKPGQWWSIPIMVTSNHPDQDLYNGTCGVLIGKSKGGIHLQSAFGYFPKKIPYKMLPPFEIAFCLSIHKSQGSEFESVLALFPEGSENFGKEAVYTAVTRAKNEIAIAADERILRTLFKQHSTKTSGFTERFSMAVNPPPIL